MGWGAEPAEETRTCEWCEKPFTTRSYIGRYCSNSCKMQAQRARDAKQRQAQQAAATKKWEVVRTPQGLRCGRCGGSVLAEGADLICQACGETWEGKVKWGGG